MVSLLCQNRNLSKIPKYPAADYEKTWCLSVKLRRQAVGELRQTGEEVLIQSKNYFGPYLLLFRNMHKCKLSLVTTANHTEQTGVFSNRPNVSKWREETLVASLLPGDCKNAASYSYFQLDTMGQKPLETRSCHKNGNSLLKISVNNLKSDFQWRRTCSVNQNFNSLP